MRTAIKHNELLEEQWTYHDEWTPKEKPTNKQYKGTGKRKKKNKNHRNPDKMNDDEHKTK